MSLITSNNNNNNNITVTSWFSAIQTNWEIINKKIDCDIRYLKLEQKLQCYFNFTKFIWFMYTIN